MATFADLRGNTTTEAAYSAAFSRANADTIHWENINTDNVPRLAEEFYRHPAIERELVEEALRRAR